MMEGQKLFAVMGATGTGKSKFIRLLSNNDSVRVGNRLVSDTVDVTPYTFEHKGVRYVLIDTPGFDDTEISDRDILVKISEWLASSYRTGARLSGVIYLHRISNPRVQGSALRNLALLKSLCGEECFKSVLLISTFWDAVEKTPEIAEAREKQLVTGFWGGLIARGATFRRGYPPTCTEAREMLRSIAEKQQPISLRVQVELVSEGKTHDTTAARAVLIEQEMEPIVQEYKRLMEEATRRFDEQIRQMREHDKERRQSLRQDYEERLRALEAENRKQFDVHSNPFGHDLGLQQSRSGYGLSPQQSIHVQTTGPGSPHSPETLFQMMTYQRQQTRTRLIEALQSAMETVRQAQARGAVKCHIKPLKSSYTDFCDHCFRPIGSHQRYGKLAYG